MKVVILAAGKGTRMLPLTKKTPKVLIPIAGKPFIWYLIENLKQAGVDEFGLIVGYKKEKIISFVKEIGLDAEIIEQKEQLGTGHALMQARDFVGYEKFLAINGDNLFSASDIKKILLMEPNVIAGFEVSNPSAYGVLIVDRKRLVRIDEKPKRPVSNLINTGLYLFGTEVFDELQKIKKSIRGEYELTDAITSLAKQNRMFVYKLKDYWIDLGKLDDIPRVEKKIRELLASPAL